MSQAQTIIPPPPMRDDESVSSVRLPSPVPPSAVPKKRGRPPGKKTGGFKTSPRDLARGDVKKHKGNRRHRNHQIVFDPLPMTREPTLPMFWTREEFLDPDACLAFARTQGVQFVVGREELKRLGLPPLFDARGWKHPDGSAFFSEDELEFTMHALREALELPVNVSVPVILFPFAGYGADAPAHAMTWPDAKRILCALSDAPRLTLESLSLPSIHAPASEREEEEENAVPRLKGLSVERLPAYQLRAVSLLLAKQLGYKPSGRVLEWTRVGDKPVALFFDGRLVCPARKTDGIPERWV